MLPLLTCVVVHLVSIGQAVDLRVGVYNYIPDLNNDGLASYKNLIQNGFQSFAEGNTVDAVVDKEDYDPYGNLTEFLSPDSSHSGFDFIELDTSTLREAVDKDLVVAIANEGFLDSVWPDYALRDQFLPAAKQAVTLDGLVYGFPTVACGNFLVSLTPDTGNLTEAAINYDRLQAVLDEWKETCYGACERVIGGQMNDDNGWYLPFLYLDGYIDIYKPSSLQSVISELLEGHVDTEVCKHLSWFIGNCKDVYGQNKCYSNFKGSYVNDSENVDPDVEARETSIYFGFLEKVGLIERDSERRATAAISWPLGPHNSPLQFTNALVINKARWNVASDEKKKTIGQFIGYFLSDSLRYDIAMGEDLDKPHPRYSLPATTTFYEQTKNEIYTQLFSTLVNAMPAPRLSSSDRHHIQQVLVDKCVQITPNKMMKEEL